MNVFSAVRPHSFPAYPYVLPQLRVFLQLTDGVGQGPAAVSGVQLETGDVVFSSQPHVIQFQDRLQVQFVVFRLVDYCDFPAPGLYSIQFRYHRHWVADSLLNLIE